MEACLGKGISSGVGWASQTRPDSFCWGLGNTYEVQKGGPMTLVTVTAHGIIQSTQNHLTTALPTLVSCKDDTHP